LDNTTPRIKPNLPKDPGNISAFEIKVSALFPDLDICSTAEKLLLEAELM
jgi:hypothetical protein